MNLVSNLLFIEIDFYKPKVIPGLDLDLSLHSSILINSHIFGLNYQHLIYQFLINPPIP